MITVKNLPPPERNIKEILRYAGIKEADAQSTALINECFAEVEKELIYKVCSIRLAITRNDCISFGNIKTDSKALQTALSDCDELIVFGATIGIGIDRLIAKYGHISPSKSVIFQAIGAERTEALCDAFCQEVSTELQKEIKWLKPRVSPGYGDIPLEIQRDIFALLDCPRKIGLTLNNSLLMSPSKSVTAIVGISNNQTYCTAKKCEVCQKSDCKFRRNK